MEIQRKKSMYQEPRVEVCTFNEKEDVLTTSVGTMSWNNEDWGSFNPNRDNTFFGE